MYRVFQHSQVDLSGFQCMYAIHEASLQSHELLWRSKSIIALIRSSSTSTEIRNYLVANPILLSIWNERELCRVYWKKTDDRIERVIPFVPKWNVKRDSPRFPSLYSILANFRECCFSIRGEKLENTNYSNLTSSPRHFARQCSVIIK